MSSKLVEAKLALAGKYERLAMRASSSVKRATFLHKAASYRRQATQYQRLLQS